MISELRASYNSQFSDTAYQAMLDEIERRYNHRPTFHICETPIFISDNLRDQLSNACQEIISFIERPDYKSLTDGAFFDASLKVPNESDRSLFLAMDFGICQDEAGNLSPQLIELQGFSTLNFFQYLLGELYPRHFDVPAHLATHFDGIDREAYRELLRQEIVGNCDPREVVLLDVEPEKQNTRIDFLITCAELGIKELCVSKVIKKGKKLYYKDTNGQTVQIKRIFNRVIFDELHQRTDLSYPPIFTEEIDAEWIGHPNWFYRISKYTLPLLKSEFVPECHFLHVLTSYPDNLGNYVLKPLYSFAGAGVILDLNKDVLDSISEKRNYLLQRKVSYAPVVDTLDEPAKVEIRMMALYDSQMKKYRLINNLVRLSKGAMIGVKYNKNKTWVGGSIGFMEPN